MKRWVCPCCGSARLAPARPLRDDVRRYCLGCSEETGRLVARVAPAIETARTRQADKLRFAGHDMQAELARLWGLGRRLPGSEAKVRRVPALRVRRSMKSHASGTAYQEEHRIVITVPRDSPVGLAFAVLAHETAHLLRPHQGHGVGFWRTYRQLVRAAYGVDVPVHRTEDRFARQQRFETAVTAAVKQE